MNILLCSVGRRPYLVRWFHEALLANGLHGEVIAADIDPNSPARAFADDFIQAPRLDESGSYMTWLSRVLADRRIDLAVSINDFELSVWATLPQDQEWRALVRLADSVQHLVEDKMAMSAALDDVGVPNPMTWLATDFPHGREHGGFVTKGRFGSGSRGLRFADDRTLADAIRGASLEVTTRHGISSTDQDEVPATDLLVVQREISGTEYGLDVVCDLDGRFQAVLAREKVTMRSGETDRAISADAGPFEDLARGIAEAIPHPGLIDVDVLVDAENTPIVIDINPRFGGGYPFSHLAGANVPGAYVAWRAGLPVDPQWLACTPGVVAGKYVEIAAVPPGRWSIGTWRGLSSAGHYDLNRPSSH